MLSVSGFRTSCKLIGIVQTVPNNTCLLPLDVFVGEAAQQLAANVDYEIPHLHKQAARSQPQLLGDLERKLSDRVEFIQSWVGAQENNPLPHSMKMPWGLC
jgi:hypothetical protein